VERKSGRIRRVKHWRLPIIVVIFVVAPAISSFARSSHSSSSGDDFGKILAVVLAVGLIILGAIYAKKPKTISAAKLAQLQAEAKEFFDKLIATGKITVPDNIPIVLGTDETALLHEPSRLIEARATRVYVGAGTRVRGIYIGGGESRSVQSLKELDSGALTLTTRRLVFTGSMESRVVDVKDIVSVEPLADAIQITAGKKVKRQVYLVHNPIIWAMLTKYVIEGKLSAVANPPSGEAPESAQLSQPEAEPSTDIRFNCPRCGQHLAVEQKGAGTAVNCPSCNEQIEIPGSR
jgi:DNA-directed RNA polymerase subunit RPC12/RpoP